MSKCKKVKNPCKICLQTVTQKNGLQCQGACQNWAHYACLDYTPGKIKDIKAGIINVTCPCPDCKTTSVKEFRTDEPFSCTNAQCPAHRPPKCENTACPLNEKQKNIPDQGSPNSIKIMNPAVKCGPICKQYKTPTNPPSESSSEDDAFFASNAPTGDSGHPYMQSVEQMCAAVGQLTTQINELMCKMKQAVQEQGGSGGCCPMNKKVCNKKGLKSQCPAPCYCPGNPAKK